MDERIRAQGRRLLGPAVGLLARAGVTPMMVTLTAVPLSILTAWLFVTGRFVLAGLAQVAAGLCDSLDGELSRRTGRASALGAFVDSTVDRLCEGLVLGGIAWYYLPRNHWYALLAVAALFFSLMVSYVRARAEGVGRTCTVGFFERSIRVVVTVTGAIVLGPRWMPVALALLALGSFVTTIHRIFHVVRQRVSV